jgi:hypothetical protein
MMNFLVSTRITRNSFRLASRLNENGTKARNMKLLQPQFREIRRTSGLLKTNETLFRFGVFFNKKEVLKYNWMEFLSTALHYILI